MARFRRRSAAAQAADAEVDPSAPAAEQEADDVAQADEAGDGSSEETSADGTSAGTPAAFDRSSGPFDVSESDSADQELARLDLGSLRIPAIPGLGIQLEAEEATQQVQAVTAIIGESAVQLRAFAAPRSEGLWDELRAETLQDIRSTSGAKVTDAVGPFGPELRAIVPARSPEGRQLRQPVRFAGVDGPRWFLQVVFLGKAAVEAEPHEDLVRVVRETVVVRGPEAMAPREQLPLTVPASLPPGVVDGEDAEADELDEDGADPTEASDRFTDIDPFERGPEITEVR